MERLQRTQRWCLGDCLSVAKTLVALPSGSSSPRHGHVQDADVSLLAGTAQRSKDQGVPVQQQDTAQDGACDSWQSGKKRALQAEHVLTQHCSWLSHTSCHSCSSS